MDATVEMKPGAGMEGKLGGTQSGVLLVDVKTGMPVSSDMTQNLKGNMKMQGVNLDMDLTTRIKMAVKEIK
jgi:hypothetical protein